MRIFSRRPPVKRPKPEPRWLTSDWATKLTTSGSNGLHRFSQWLLTHLRAWETRTPVSSRRRQVLLVFGLLGMLGIIRLFYLFQQPLPQPLKLPVSGLWSAPSPGRILRPEAQSIDSAYQQSRFIYQKSRVHP